ncbi:ABC transporter C family member 10-like [Dorcoceras hygrometricum]|uniref:ABC transporter C family member 10-like n=1 Tax=Dorcoceras hygrometricum TaxID=472368 RepID=A0A2Z7D6K6_9LAMI|nr:ABC transporter C family member 10-like [Dorcoceras hygrometricum]
MMNNRRICPADGSQYKQSAVGLMFMESAAGLAMETSKVESAVRNQAEAKLNQLEHIARYDGSSRELQYYASNRKDPDARKADVAKHCNQAQSIQSTKISAEDEFSRSDKPEAKQLTIYEETLLNGKKFVSNGINSNRGFIYFESAIEDVLTTSTLLVGDNQSAVAEVNRTVHQQRENESEVKLQGLAGRRPQGCGRPQQIACGSWPHAGRNSRGQAVQRRRTTAPHHRSHVAQGCRPARNNLHGQRALRRAKQRPAMAQQLRKAVGPSAGHHAEQRPKSPAEMRDKRAYNRAAMRSKCAGHHASRRLAPTSFTGKLALQRLAAVVLRIRSTTGNTTPSSVCTRRSDEFTTNGISLSRWSEQVQPRRRRHTAVARRRVEEAAAEEEKWGREAATS